MNIELEGCLRVRHCECAVALIGSRIQGLVIELERNPQLCFRGASFINCWSYVSLQSHREDAAVQRKLNLCKNETRFMFVYKYNLSQKRGLENPTLLHI